MLLKLYDKNMKYLRAIADYKDLRITEELETGYKVAQFSLPYNIIVTEEQKVEIENYLYVIKEVNMRGEGLYEVYCKPYFGTLASKYIDSLNGTGMTIQSAMSKILEGTDWVWGIDKDLAGAILIELEYMTALEAIATIVPMYEAEIYFDTKGKTVYLFNKRSRLVNTWVLNASNLRKCQVQSNTYDIITRLIPLGEDGMNIREVNKGKAWVEDYSYTDEVIVGYYVNDEVLNAQDLLALARQELDKLSWPHTTYKVFLSEFPKDISVGDEVRIMDKLRDINDLRRVSKIVRYPSSPEDSYLELGDPGLSFDKIYKTLSDAQSKLKLKSLNTATKNDEESGEATTYSIRAIGQQKIFADRTKLF